MDIEVVTPVTVEAEVQRYTLVSDDIYVRRYDNGNIPEWYRSMLEDIIKNDPTIDNIGEALNFLTAQGEGYHQSIVNLETVDSSLNASYTTLMSQVGANTAGIGTLNVTKVDSTQAVAISQNVVGAAFGVNGVSNAWFSNKISTHASNIAANASNISTLSAALGDQEVRIDTVEQVAIDASGWSAVASKLITNPSGGITGWSFADGSGVSSDFRIHATNFKISDGTTGYTPFSIAGSNVKFNGVVDFTSTNTYGATTIDGSKITTGSITAGQIAANTITSSQLTTGIALINGEVKSSNFTTVGGAGFRLKSNAAGTFADPTIYGAYIRGGYIYGSTIDSATMNVRQLNVLTDGGMPTTAFFTEHPRFISGDSNNNNVYRYDLYSYNSTNASKKKLSGYSDTTIVFSGGGTFLGYDSYSYFGDISVGAYGVTISVYTGATLIGTASFGGYAAGQYKSVAGLTFYWVNSGSGDINDWIVVKQNCTLTMAGNGMLEFRTYNLNFLSTAITVHNI